MLNPIQLPITFSPESITNFCDRWKVVEFAVFGSVLRDNFNDNSDIDILVTFDESAHPTLFSLVEMTDELETLLGRNVDLHTRNSIETSRNPLIRKHILSNAQVIYAK